MDYNAPMRKFSIFVLLLFVGGCNALTPVHVSKERIVIPRQHCGLCGSVSVDEPTIELIAAPYARLVVGPTLGDWHEFRTPKRLAYNEARPRHRAVYFVAVQFTHAKKDRNVREAWIHRSRRAQWCDDFVKVLR